MRAHRAGERKPAIARRRISPAIRQSAISAVSNPSPEELHPSQLLHFLGVLVLFGLLLSDIFTEFGLRGYN
jgi:hypothetical protein